MLEKCKSFVDEGKSLRTFLTDLSKAFDYLSHNLLLAKLHAYSFNHAILQEKAYAKDNRKPRTNTQLLEKQKPKIQNRFNLAFLGGNTLWGTIRVYSRTLTFSKFSCV